MGSRVWDLGSRLFMGLAGEGLAYGSNGRRALTFCFSAFGVRICRQIAQPSCSDQPLSISAMFQEPV